MEYLYVKALHIIFVVAWFAALFYLPRLFIYHTEAFAKDEPIRSALIEQFVIMEKRLINIIMWPAAIITLVLGIRLTMIIHTFGQEWFSYKLVFLVFLYLYHCWMVHIYKRLLNGQPVYTSNQLRMINEIATILLFAIVFVVILKNFASAVYGTLGLLFLAILLMMGIKLYKKYRKSS